MRSPVGTSSLLTRYAQAYVAHPLTRIRKHVGPGYERLLANEHAHIGRLLHACPARPPGEKTLFLFSQTYSQNRHNDSMISCSSFVCQAGRCHRGVCPAREYPATTTSSCVCRSQAPSSLTTRTIAK